MHVMKNLKLCIILLSFCSVFSNCDPKCPNPDSSSTFVENLVSITPIRSQFQVNDTLTLICTIPSQNIYFGNFETNIFRETAVDRALWRFSDVNTLLANQQLIVRKGFQDGPFFLALYNASCDCYEFEADLILSEIGSYSFSTSHNLQMLNDCGGYLIDTTFPWVNQPNVLEFEVVP